MTEVPVRRGNLDTEIHGEGEDRKTQGEDSHTLDKEKGLERILPSQPLEGINPANIWTWTLASRSVRPYVSGPWSFVTTALAIRPTEALTELAMGEDSYRDREFIPVLGLPALVLGSSRQ